MNEFEEDYFEQENYHYDDETGDWVSNQRVSVDVTDFITANNKEYFNQIKEIFASGNVYLNCGIHKMNIPYYESHDPFTGKTVTLFLNKDIISYILIYLQQGIISDKNPDVLKIDKNINEDYILRLIKKDRQNEATRYNNDTGYKAVYPYGIINYGKLPYTVEELIKKLDSLGEV